ncbi:cation diffusion facilitator family transporter [Mycobacterium sp. ACS1612]|uniref:cation diffusion facilitator family transporter n=1 Tax=Mycobacterium sp. ACS1612 TaxID=1834117 RepID=UPI0008021996|nr:cation transporter [Mycobacterium sp. ACS1612]OBF32116.1 cation diffusion facilitator family transporter [Mycobacterium sp. ACS1612]
MAKAGGESALTVLVAFGANLAIAAAKTAAAAVSGSASMLAEAAHSWADTGNEVFLLIANRRSARPADDRRPLGYGREAYVWSLLAAIGLFVVGASVSIWHGITELTSDQDPGGRDYTLAYVVLAVSLVLESISFTQAVRQLRAEAHTLHRDLLTHALETSDPTTRAVFAEDAAALVGLVIAGTGIALHELTGVAAWDAIGSILVGVLLGVVAVLLIDRNRRFLTGEPGSADLRDAAVTRVRQLDGVAEVRYLRLEFIGPKQLFLVASVDLTGDDAESSVARRLRHLERELEDDPYVVDAVLTVSEPDDAGSHQR